MALDKYNKKRDFDKTPEPAGGKKAGATELRFVVQRHQASTLHYDFRLEMEGVLKSWAVPKGPSLDPEDKRLAMMVEDHPYSYRTFEGDIPEGNYGAGHVDIWDEGTYTAAGAKNKAAAEKELLQGLAEGSISFVLQGNKLQGEFALVKMKGRQKDAWLLIKKRDEFAQEGYDSEEHLSKAVTGKKTAVAAKPKATATPAATAEKETEKKSKKDTVKSKPADKAK
ncbi:MAG: DNA ligase, partial [Chitinophagaceae bacterium]